jgi:TatD DNase family protein
MNSKFKFINIHTHIPENSPDVTAIYNLAGNENTIQNYFSAGIHPWYIDELNFESQLKSLEKSIQQKICLFIGECGLDKLKCSDFSVQQKVFSAQIELAVKYNKPIILHCVKAFNETLSLLKDKIETDKIIFHGFHKSAELAEELTSKGFYVSLGKVLKTHPEKAKLILQKTNPRNLFFETDDEPISIREMYKMASEISDKPIDFWMEQLSANFDRITSVKIEQFL